MVNLDSLNGEQREAVVTPQGPLLILAGAGTGKTRVITYRIAYLIERGVSPENILAVTFTNKAAKEMRERVRRLIRKKKNADKKNSPTTCTFHSLAVRILRKHIGLLGYKPNFVIYSESEQLGVVRKVLSRLNLKGKDAEPKTIRGWISGLKNAGGDSHSVAQPDSIGGLVARFVEYYDQSLKACNAVDFDDLLLLTLRLLEEHPAVLEDCRNQYRYLLADEYQDTNAVQFQIIKLLAEKHRNLCVVGDDDQSIYGWRGAKLSNLLHLEDHFPEIKVIKLQQNYRSTNTILKAANALIRNNTQRRPKQLWSAKGEGAPINLHCFQHSEEEAGSIVDQVEFNRIARRITWGNQAILFRTNQQARILETALRKKTISYRLVGGQSYFDRKEIVDFLAYLKLILNPHDDINLLRVANVPARGLSDRVRSSWLAESHEKQCSVYSVMKDISDTGKMSARGRTGLKVLLDLIHNERDVLQCRDQLSMKKWAEGIMDHVGYFQDIPKWEKNEESVANRIRNINQLIQTLGNTGAPTETGFQRLEKFLEEISLDSSREEQKEEGRDEVTLITMHSCKGLEFPHVFIVGVEKGLLPHERSEREGTLEEERRLFYVGITRAQISLTLSYSMGRKLHGQTLPSYPSPFLLELPDELVIRPEDAGAQSVTPKIAKDVFASIRDAIG
ncbi:MAG TPA: DNA helicase UvrD [Verrucomicrobiales bacterium]|nr:DNA helicase UvrD [Verrucomicrobiales bacterium]HIL71853.1 DNA helicase UvrD [Verrucomicrobiota bacterium]